jgi:hypothetical protein
MSIQSSPRATTTPPGTRYDVRECEHCDGHYPLAYGFNRRFCRRECKYRNIAQSLLDGVRYDHKYCANCHKRLKDISPPAVSRRSAEKGRSPPECAVGRQQWRSHTVHDQHNIGENSGDRAYPSLDMREGMACSCSVNHHTTIDRPNGGLPKETAIEYADQLADALDERREADAHHTEFDRAAFLAFVERGKSRPGLQGRDQEILRNGLALAIREHP